MFERFSEEDWIDYLNYLRKDQGNYYPDVDVSVPTATPVENALVERMDDIPEHCWECGASIDERHLVGCTYGQKAQLMLEELCQQ